ncbi:C-type lectin lectoxin-Lio3-like [Haliotis asinina]|uniref:C-type lectin lectoxin-Lio3-like n=1 Tax=Haliotis asinina TaxID=109174 RepID=UPI003531DEDE
MYRLLFFLLFAWSVSCQEPDYTASEEQLAIPGNDDDDGDMTLVEFPEDFGAANNENLEERLHKLENLVSKLQKTCSTSCQNIQEADGCPQDYIWNKDLNFCYKIHDDDRLKWATAQAVCATEVPGGRLVIFDKDEKRQAVLKTLMGGKGKSQNYFVGALRTQGTFKWTDGTAMSNVTWCEDEPNGTDCGSMWSLVGYCIDDVPCSWDQGFVCEKSMK